MTTQLHSPLHWIGGKARSAQRIVEAFPHPSTYDVYGDVFCGACHVIFAKPPSTHLEAINDLNKRLVNFWMQVRDEAEHLQWKLKTLPYAECLFEVYRQEIETGDEIEQAARWYYVNRSTIMGHNDSGKGWMYAGAHVKSTYDVPSKALSYHNAVETLTALTERLGNVQIHAWDFARMIEKYQSPRTLFYCDPPYHGAERYYAVDNTPPFTADDHKRLATLLNATPAMVALSYYDSPELDMLYPLSKWRRIAWTIFKDTSRMNKELQIGHEVLLCNYAVPAQQLTWEMPA